jgi:putative DNA primase/helicase
MDNHDIAARLSAKHELAADAQVDRSKAAPQFLQKLRPGGPWVLTAIIPDGRTTTITAKTEDEVRAFVCEHDGARNIYFSVNPTRQEMRKKPAKGDVAAVEYVLADLDPRDGEAPNVAKARYLDAIADHNPEATAVIDSGNGIQALFKLRERIVIGAPVRWDEDDKPVFSDKDQAAIDDVEARSKALMQSFGAKAGTQNIDRILRLPGTTNLPNEKKRRDGRVPCPAWLISFNGARYDIGDFSLESEEAGGAAELSDYLRALLHVPDDGKFAGYPSRSEIVFAFLCEAVRAGVSDDTILDACLDDDYAGCAIYDHIREQSGRNCAVRQLARAKEKVRQDRPEMFTDLGNARRLVRLFGKDLRYVHAWRNWLVWDDGHWRRDDDQGVMRKAKAAVEAMFAEASQINDEDRRKAHRNYALKSQDAKRLAAMINLAQSESEVILSVNEIDADPFLLGVQNGIVDLRTGTFREARREDCITKRAGTAFDAGARCPNWEAFLKRVLPEDVIAYLQRVAGYILTGSTAEEVFWVMWGSGSNGKSTVRETLFALLGDYAVGADASLLVVAKQGGATPELARLHGCRLVTINETKENDQLNAARMKYITSHDVITARSLYEAPFDFAPSHKTILTTNHKLIVRSADEGTWRRIHFLPFTKKIAEPDRDKQFRERKLLPELAGILNWVLEGLRAYQREGLNPPATVTEATKDYREDMDLVGQWIAARCQRNPESVLSTSALHRDYDTWARDEVGFSMSTIAFGRALVERGFAKVKADGGRGIRGLELLAEKKDDGALTQLDPKNFG